MGENHLTWREDVMIKKSDRNLAILQEYKEMLQNGVSSADSKRFLAKKYKFKHENSITGILGKFDTSAYRTYVKYRHPKITSLNSNNVILTGLEVGGGKFCMEDFGFNFSRFKGRHFVYFLQNDSNTCYVGVTSNLFARICSHKGSKVFSEVLILEYDSKALALKMELLFINIYKPILNWQMKKLKIKRVTVY